MNAIQTTLDGAEAGAGRQSAGRQPLGQYAAVVAGALGVGGALFTGMFLAMHYAWMEYVAVDASHAAPTTRAAVMAVGGGLALGGVMAVTGAVWMLVRFWPGREFRSGANAPADRRCEEGVLAARLEA